MESARRDGGPRLFSSAITLLMMLEFFRVPLPGPLPALIDMTRPFRSANHYVLFPTIPLERRMIVFEGSNDGGTTWRPYEYRYQAQRLDVRPRFFAPASPRFDRESARSVEVEPPLPYTQVPVRLAHGTKAPRSRAVSRGAVCTQPVSGHSSRHGSNAALQVSVQRLADSRCQRELVDVRVARRVLPGRRSGSLNR